jgi:hypothetical protein
MSCYHEKIDNYSTFFIWLVSPTLAEDLNLNFNDVSELPIHTYESKQSKANMTAIIGGKGMKNTKGKSKNFLVTQKRIFINLKLNYYLFPNFSETEKATYPLRLSKNRLERILNLVEAIKKRNSLPTYLVGFSRGSVDAATFSKLYPEHIKGIVLASGVYTNTSKKAELFSMERIIGKKSKVAVLVTHHKKDKCKVTQFKYAKKFYDRLDARRKYFLILNEGVPTGRKCGPLHHHGYENIEEEVAKNIAGWINTDAIK